MNDDNHAILRIPRKNIVNETDEYIVVDMGDGETFVKGVLMAYGAKDDGKAVVFTEDEE